MDSQQTSFKKLEIVEMPSQKMAVVTTIGEPSVEGEKVMPALYGAV